MTDQPVAVVDTIVLLDQITDDDIRAVYVKGYHSAGGRGGGLLRRTTDSSQTNEVTTFKGAGVRRWVRDLNGGTLDAYMAGAVGDGRLTVDGKIDVTSQDDTRAIQALFEVYKRSVDPFTDSATLHIRIGDGVFRVGSPNDDDYPGLDLTQFPSGARSWVIDGTGATLLGGCANVPVVDATDSRFGTFLNLQIIGAVPEGADDTHYPSCGLRIGRRADNEAANLMTTDHVGIRGVFKLAAMLNVASEQFTEIGCEFSNDAAGPVYGSAGDQFNMLQWTRPAGFSGITSGLNATYTVSGAIIDGLAADDVILVRADDEDEAQPFTEHLLTVVSVDIPGGTFVVKDLPGTTPSYGPGKYYKQLFGGALPTPDFTPWTQASFKQQYHLQGNHRAPRGIAAILDGADSGHVFEDVHPTGGFYPASDQAYTFTLSKGAHTTISGIAPAPGTNLLTGHLVSFTRSGLADRLDDRLFKLGDQNPSGTFELLDPMGETIDSSGWAVPSPALVGMVRQFVAAGNDATKGGFGLRLVVGAKSGCDLSRYSLHHEPGDARDNDTMTGEATWWGKVDSFEGLRDGTPAPVLLSDVTFAEPAAHGRGGFLLAGRDTTSGVTMIGGKIAVTHTQGEFGSTTIADKLLMATGTVDPLWTLAGTELVLEEAALVDLSRLAGFSGRLTSDAGALVLDVALRPRTAGIAALLQVLTTAGASPARVARRWPWPAVSISSATPRRTS